MENILESSRKLFIEKNKGKISSIYNNAIKDSDYFQQYNNVEEFYYLLKHLRDTSAILKLNDLFDIVSHLLRHFKVEGLKYKIAENKEDILLEGLRILVKYFLSESSNVELKFMNNLDTGILDDKTIRLLIIDNDETFIEWLKESLTGTEFCLYANNINDLKGYVLKENIDLVLINTIFQKNFELIKDLKSHTWTAHIPIFAITHVKDEAGLIKIYKQGVDDIIIKPFSINLFIAKLRNFFSRSSIFNNQELLSMKSQNHIMTELLKKEWVRFQRFNSYYSILLVKLDMYGKLLDIYGHEKVLEYLTILHQAIKKSIRTYDEIKLWNNDSLLVLLPATRVEGASFVAKRIKQLSINLDLSYLSKYLLIGTVESDNKYLGPLDMVKKLEKELISTSTEIFIAQTVVHSEDIKPNLRRKVLLIDDDPATLTILGNHLNSDDWIIEELTDGTKALDKALEMKPDIIVAETRLKDFDGYDFCYQIRQFPNLRDTIFFFLSKQALNKSIIRGIKIGADDYITKPFSPEEVEIRVLRHLTNRKRR